ncbi:hypothetical protein [Gemmatimonas sp.]|uniref:hypothetical protein n=1 Tax=Gemmatimonas sp. TaxID=1962908 RepID=UPI003F7189CE
MLSHQLRIFVRPDGRPIKVQTVRVVSARGVALRPSEPMVGKKLERTSARTKYWIDNIRQKGFSDIATYEIGDFSVSGVGYQASQDPLEGDQNPSPWNPDTDPFSPEGYAAFIDQTAAEYDSAVNAYLAAADAELLSAKSKSTGRSDLLHLASFRVEDDCGEKLIDVNDNRFAVIAAGAGALVALWIVGPAAAVSAIVATAATGHLAIATAGKFLATAARRYREHCGSSHSAVEFQSSKMPKGIRNTATALEREVGAALNGSLFSYAAYTVQST